MAGFTLYPVDSSTASDFSYGISVIVDKIPFALSFNLLLLTFKSTIKFSYTLPTLIIDAVVIIFKIILCAVAAFIRVDPVNTSGPVTTSIFTSAYLLIRSEEHTSELQSRFDLVCRLLLEKKNSINKKPAQSSDA